MRTGDLLISVNPSRPARSCRAASQGHRGAGESRDRRRARLRAGVGTDAAGRTRGTGWLLRRLRSFASASSNSTPGWWSRPARPGPKPRPTSAKPSISANTTRARCCGWPSLSLWCRLPGERDEMVYLPLGAGVIIPPWNFPLAILAGMTVAALVAGNTVVIKPSSETPTIAAKFVEVLHAAGFPPRSFALCTGSGAVIGDLLVEHPKTRFVSFTGSREVGLRINELAAKPRQGQIWIKRVVAEMGGKDAIIVDREADLDSAVAGVVQSAFGYQGQKCSACSRAIVDDPVYDEFLEKLQAQRGELTVGPPEDRANYHGAGDQRGRAQDHSQLHRSRARRRAAGRGRRNGVPGDGYFVQPTVIADVDSQGAYFSGRDFRAGAGGFARARFRPCAGTRQRHRIRADRRGVLAESREDAARARGILRGQPVYQPQMHGRDGGGASLWRIQYVGHRFEGGRPGLSAAVPASQVDRGKTL